MKKNFNVHQKLVPDPFLILRYFERGLSKNLKKMNFIFFIWTQSLLMDKIIKSKGDLELVTSSSSEYKASWEKFLR